MPSRLATCKWQVLEKVHLPTQSTETNSLSALTGNSFTCQTPAVSLIGIHKLTWRCIQSHGADRERLPGFHCLCIRPHKSKASRSPRLHQRSTYSLCRVSPMATPAAAHPRGQPAYPVEECTFAAYTYVLDSPQQRRRERLIYCRLPVLKGVLQCRERIISQNGNAFTRFKIGTSTLQQK